MNRKRLKGFLYRWYRPVLGAFLIFTVCFYLFGWKLGSLPAGFSPEEKVAIAASSSIDNIVNNPVNAPHKVPQYAIQKTLGDSPLQMRAVSVFYGILAVFCFYLVIKWWFKYKVALVSTLLFATCPWLVINSRSATATIMLLSSLAIITAYLWLQSSNKHHDSALIVMALAGSLSLYIPGVFWITLVGVIVAKRPLSKFYKQASSIVRYSLPLLVAMLVTPLVYASIINPDILKELLLVPEQLLNPLESIVAIIWAGLGIIWRTRDSMPTTLGNLPILNAFEVVLLIIGSFWMLTEVKRRRTYWIFGSILLTILVVGLGHKEQELLLILPAIYIIIAGGLHFMYKEWFRVFPRNPLAKWVGIGVISIAVGISLIYSVRYSLIAWPNSPETSSYYVIQ